MIAISVSWFITAFIQPMLTTAKRLWLSASARVFFLFAFRERELQDCSLNATLTILFVDGEILKLEIGARLDT